jgi:hypothetical protein
MTALATTTDVEGSLGRSLTTDEIPRASSLLTLASAHVESSPVTGYRFAPGAYTVGREVRSFKIRLPGKVATIAAVRSIDPRTGAATVLVAGTNYNNRGSTLYLIAGYGGYNWESTFAVGPARARMFRTFIEVDFTVTAPVPDEIVNLVAGIVASTLSGPPVGASAETAGPFHISYVNSSGKVWLSASDKAILGRYKQPKPAIDLTAHGI